MTDQTRLLQVTEGNLRQSHFYITGHLDFFPKSAFGLSKRSKNGDGAIEITFDGLNETVKTDIGTEAATGKPRRFLRARGLVGRFYELHGVKPGSMLALEKLAANKFRLSVASDAPSGRPRAAEFFAGIGLVRLALEQQGWDVVFANDIDAAKAEMYRHNWPKDDTLRVGDIHELDVEEIPSCDLFTASFPCNDLSIAGRWDGLDGEQS